MSNHSVHISVIMPAYNEEEHLEQAVLLAQSTVEKLNTSYEILIVNDHSTDATASIGQALEEAHAHIRVVHNTGAQGKGAALRYGYTFATGNYLFFLDADLDIPATQIPTFLEVQNTHNADVVIGCKLHPQSTVNFPKRRKLISRGYQLLVRCCFRLPVSDTQTGIKLFRREVVENTFRRMHTNRYAYDLEALLLAHKQGYSIIEAPVVIQFSRSAGSRIGLKAIQCTLVETLHVWWRYVRGKYNYYSVGQSPDGFSKT